MSERAVDPRHAAVLHGCVFADDSLPIEGVVISVLGHPKFCQTTCRNDGGFGIAVDGGGPLVMHFEISGRVDVETAVYPRWQEDAFVPDVVVVGISYRSAGVEGENQRLVDRVLDVLAVREFLHPAGRFVQRQPARDRAIRL